MPRETDLLRVKLVAHTLLDAQIQETALSPVICLLYTSRCV